MERLKKQIIDVETGLETIVDYTDEEMTQWELDRAQYLEEQAQRETEIARIAALKESAKAKLVAGQPLTEEEAATLVI